MPRQQLRRDDDDNCFIGEKEVTEDQYEAERELRRQIRMYGMGALMGILASGTYRAGQPIAEAAFRIGEEMAVYEQKEGLQGD